MPWGGKPLVAIAILGWPVDKLPVELAQKVMEGGRSICAEAGIPLAGGHSIDSTEPIFGLAVTGILPKQNLKRNDTAEEGDIIFLTKALGVGVLSTAQKRNLLKEEHLPALISQMVSLNKIGEELGKMSSVTAMTDVTGFGFLGHLIEMAEGSGLCATVNYDKIKTLPGVKEYIAQRIFPDATTRNWSGYGSKVKFEKGVNVMEAFTLLPDPQTNGGLLIAVKEAAQDEIKKLLSAAGLAEYAEPIGKMIRQEEKIVKVL